MGEIRHYGVKLLGSCSHTHTIIHKHNFIIIPTEGVRSVLPPAPHVITLHSNQRPLFQCLARATDCSSACAGAWSSRITHPPAYTHTHTHTHTHAHSSPRTLIAPACAPGHQARTHRSRTMCVCQEHAGLVHSDTRSS